MSLNSKINELTKRLNSMRPEPGQIAVRVGVWFCDENGVVIENSGKTMLVPKRLKNKYGMMLVRRPAASRLDAYAEFEAEVKKCNEYQKKLNEKQNQTN